MYQSGGLKRKRVKIYLNKEEENSYQGFCSLCLKASLQATLCGGSLLGIRRAVEYESS